MCPPSPEIRTGASGKASAMRDVARARFESPPPRARIASGVHGIGRFSGSGHGHHSIHAAKKANGTGKSRRRSRRVLFFLPGFSVI